MPFHPEFAGWEPVPLSGVPIPGDVWVWINPIEPGDEYYKQAMDPERGFPVRQAEGNQLSRGNYPTWLAYRRTVNKVRQNPNFIKPLPLP